MKKFLYSIPIWILAIMTSQLNATGIIITGGPGSGKTSIIRELDFRGKIVSYEAAQDFILLNQARQDKISTLSPLFDLSVAQMQLQREERLFDKYDDEVIFLDRGVFDNLAFIEFYSKEMLDEFRNLVEKQKEKLFKYKMVFLVENLGHSFQNGYRSEDLSSSLQLEQILKRIYQDLGFQVISIPADSVENRVDRLLEYVGSLTP